MVLLSGVNMVLMMLKDNSSFHVPELYFEILSVALAAMPVIWNNILDVAKKDCLNETTDSLEASGSHDTSPTDSPKIDSHNESNESER